jgi:hypothetical protein
MPQREFTQSYNFLNAYISYAPQMHACTCSIPFTMHPKDLQGFLTHVRSLLSGT